MDRNEKFQHTDAELKQLINDQISMICSLKMNKRESANTIAHHITPVATSTNEGNPHLKTPAMSCFIHYTVTDHPRADRHESEITKM